MSELDNLNALEGAIFPGFVGYREVPVRHALFTKHLLRVDLLGVPRDPAFSDLLVGFEVKRHKQDKWSEQALAKTVKQASDYCLATVEPDRDDIEFLRGRRVLAAFIWPAPLNNDAFRRMFQVASYFRVGAARIDYRKRDQRLEMRLGQVIWSTANEWSGVARTTLAGKRQIGSQRFNVLDELQALDRAVAHGRLKPSRP